ncbi:unnamed protein product [Ambrosiozyma monospora]|uniref:Unnamed protein product n=1 Tax=Ambrosiozyma monospora TaxID=43982 RepID=A0A9W6YSV7_AMBMO|nr:unnamed protein product [Ambrosiozyma monospora]
MSKAWNGSEDGYTAGLRMVSERVNKQVKKIPVSNGKLSSRSGGPLFTKKKSIQERLHDARETAIDYQISKLEPSKNKSKNTTGSSFEEEDDFAERYRERLLGPAQFLNDSFSAVDNSIKSLADQKIMEAQRRGEFKNLSNRGKPLPKDFTNDSAYLDRTEYHLNNILKKQDAMPPWIEKMGRVELEIDRFRKQLDDDWLRRAVNLVNEMNPGLNFEEKLKKVQSYAVAENSESGDEEKQLVKLRSREWELKEDSYLTTKIRKLNDSIRGYNLQAPLPSQKLYLMKNNELEKCYKRASKRLVSAYERHSTGGRNGSGSVEKHPDETGQNGKLLRFGEVYQRDPASIYQRPTESIGSLFMGIFRSNPKK